MNPMLSSYLLIHPYVTGLAYILPPGLFIRIASEAITAEMLPPSPLQILAVNIPFLASLVARGEFPPGNVNVIFFSTLSEKL